VLAQLKDDYPEDLRFVFRHFPLDSIHDKALLAAQAAEAAGLQGEFWSMYDLLFEQHSEWSSLSVEEFQDWLTTRAEELELDVEQFETDLTSDEIVSLAQNAWETGQEIGIPGTPFFVVNGLPYQGPSDYANLAAIIELSRLEQVQFTECPPMTIDPLKRYIATFETEKGEFVIELFPDVAPIAVNNFVFLANEGWYDGITFHRVMEGFVAQAGDPTGTGFGGPGYAFVNETDPDVTFDAAGLVAMANAGPDSNGSQFFITYGPTEQLNGNYTIFGEVIEGMDVVRSLSPRDPSQGINLPPGDEIIKVTVEER
jgi:cyclophilin family peptidyl-prolyl cis-trans isomerase